LSLFSRANVCGRFLRHHRHTPTRRAILSR
jgi:hypothetical protein